MEGDSIEIPPSRLVKLTDLKCLLLIKKNLLIIIGSDELSDLKNDDSLRVLS